MSVVLDHIDGARATHQLIEGYSITRMATVTGLQPASLTEDWDTGAILQAAEAELIAEVGPRGTPLASISVPTFLESFNPTMISDEEVRFAILYKGYPLPTFEFSAALSNINSPNDVHGTAAFVQYAYPSNYVAPSGSVAYAGKTITDGGLISIPMPELTFSVKFIIGAFGPGGGSTPGLTLGSMGDTGYMVIAPASGQTATEVASWFTYFEGTICNGSYTLGVRTGNAKQWLINSVRGTTRDGGFTYEMTLTFQFRTQGWDQFVVYINPDTGRPPSDLVPGTGSKTLQMFLETTFPTFSFGGN